jgi:hypothetical protein
MSYFLLSMKYLYYILFSIVGLFNVKPLLLKHLETELEQDLNVINLDYNKYKSIQKLD